MDIFSGKVRDIFLASPQTQRQVSAHGDGPIEAKDLVWAMVVLIRGMKWSYQYSSGDNNHFTAATIAYSHATEKVP